MARLQASLLSAVFKLKLSPIGVCVFLFLQMYDFKLVSMTLSDARPPNEIMLRIEKIHWLTTFTAAY